MRLPIRFVRCGRFVRAEYSDFNPYLGSFHHVAAFSLKDYNRLVMEGFGFDEEPELKMRFAPGSRGQCARQMADALHLKKVYGKIYGDFEFEGDDKKGLIGVKFLYYLNPTSLARNLEWDMKHNHCSSPGNVGAFQP